MTDEEKNFFDALNKDRSETARTMSKISMRGLWSGVVEKYTDQAHFIYELLQNADDAGATSAHFILCPNKITFMHDGTRHFSISDPNNEEADTENGTLGDVNAITSAANSNKIENKIGKFGVGFKAVFQYTGTPHIYDKNFAFKIENYIVPVLLKSKNLAQDGDGTIFMFPFNHKTITPERAECEIAAKLAALVQPTLFLKNLHCVKYEYNGVVGSYEKSIETIISADGVNVELIHIRHANFGLGMSSEQSQDFLMFTKSDRVDNNDVEMSVGFLLDQNKIKPAHYNAFCFFQTKEKTGLNFIIHAPFLLNESREGIRADHEYNKKLIQKLAGLAASAFPFIKDMALIDDDILNIIPCDPNAFTDPDNHDQISFRPFYDEIKKIFQTEELLPTAVDKKYVTSENAYWARSTRLNQLFDNAQLRMLTGNSKAMWVFPSVTERHVGGAAINKYIRELVAEKSFEDENLLPKINGAFIEQQKIGWLRDFYSYLTETALRMKLTQTLPIFLNQDRKAAAAFDPDGRATLFLPSEGMEGYPTVYKELLKDKEIAQCLKQFGIKEPSLKDEIYNKILPQYQAGKKINTLPHIGKFLRYYIEASAVERDKLISTLKKYKFVYIRTLDNEIFRCIPNKAYFYSEELARYFEGMNGIFFVRPEDYEAYIPKREQWVLKDFLKAVDVNFDMPRIIEHELSDGTLEKRIEGCQQLLQSIPSDKNKSLILWRMLVKMFEHKKIDPKSPRKTLYEEPSLHSSLRHPRKSDSSDITKLRQTPWVLDREGNLRKPSELDSALLNIDYDRRSEGASRLIEFLKIADVKNLTAEQLRKIRLANMIEQNYSEAEIKDLLNRRKTKIDPTFRAEPSNERSRPAVGHSSDHTVDTSNAPTIEDETIKDVDEKISPPAVDYSKKIDELKQKLNNALSQLERQEELSARADTLEKYSYEWFNTLLELEKLNSNAADSRAIAISFGRIERQPDTKRSVILKFPNRYIPSTIEELTDIPLELYSRGAQVAKLIIDAVSIKSFTLRVKLKDIDKLNGIDLAAVDEIWIKADSPAFLLDALINSFNALGFDPTFNLKSHLPINIDFIFGPPGTGKTTYLAHEVLIPLMRRSSARILVLTPTNKAADVLVRRIITSLDAQNDQSYQDWLIRFVSTNDEFIEQCGVVRERTFDVTRLNRCIVATTIARFPYDYFNVGDKRLSLQQMNWDYIIIDEASMIPLANIIFPLHKKTPAKFIIAGDPFQIEPITNVAQWKDENIYSMVELASFKRPSTAPHHFNVITLNTQYRSIPAVGDIFSRFTYEGVLKHHRLKNSQRRLNLNLPFRTLNLIKFPVSKYESIYRAKKLKSGSSYQIYSALFTFEFVKNFARSLAVRNLNENFSIGIITPYRAEGDLINKLSASMHLPPTIDIQVGTIHGFQGDECDIIFVVLNPPPFISSSNELFINKINILNVAISRARDYLFVLMPDDQTANVEQLYLVKRLERLIKSGGEHYEMASKELEEIIFGSPTFIEDNAFSTAHQDVNIYGTVERRYEIRSEETAVDIQLHY